MVLALPSPQHCAADRKEAMTRNQVKRAAMRYRRLEAQARAVQLEAVSQRDKADCRGRAFAWAHCARWLEGVLRRMKK